MAISWTSAEARRLWAALTVLLTAVLAPTACVLWFMNAAVANERLAVRQRLQDVYSGELSLRQRRVDESMAKIIAVLEAARDKPAAVAFADVVQNAGTSSALIYRDGRLVYPTLTPQESSAATGWPEDSGRARALLAEARALLLSNPARAVALLTGPLQSPDCEGAIDVSGRLIAPNAALLAIETIPTDGPNQAERSALIHPLAERLRQYDGPVMSAPQRLFLMQRVHAISGEDFPTMRAETLALRLLPINQPSDAESAGMLHSFRNVPNTWAFSDSSAQAVAVFTTSDLTARLGEGVQDDAPAGTSLKVLPPGSHPHDEFLAMSAGQFLPGWTVSISLTGADPFATAARRHELTYLWAGCLAIAVIAAAACALAAYLRRQMHVTRLKNDLITTVSHELKTPLASMRVLTDTLLAGRLPTVQAQREYLGLIARENMRLSRLIDNFLTFSRMERTKATFDLRPVRVRDVIDAAIEALGPRAAVVSVRVHLAPGSAVMGDEGALTTLLLNLLDNAWKYSGDDRKIAVSADLIGDAPNAMVEIAVEDNGIGIARRHQRRIFQCFFQVDRALSNHAGGCGLGLAIVQFIAAAHHATVAVSSRLHHGSTFRVRLPACRDSLPTATRTNGHALANAAGEPMRAEVVSNEIDASPGLTNTQGATGATTSA